MDSRLACVLCLVCYIQVSFAQRFLIRNPEARFDPRWSRPAISSSQGEWGDPFPGLRSGPSREDRQIMRVHDIGLLGDRLTSRNRHSGMGSRTRSRGSHIAIEIDSRGRTSSRGRTRFIDSGFLGDSRRFRSSHGSSSTRSSFDSFNSRNSPDIIMISSRLPSSDRRITDNGGQFADVGIQSSSQPVIIRSRDQVLSRSDFIRSSRPPHDTRVKVEPVVSSSQSTVPSGSWQEMNVPQLQTGVDSFNNNQPQTTTIINNTNAPTNTGTRSPDILIQTSAHVSPGGSNSLVSQSTTSTNVTNKGTLSNTHTVSAHAPASSSLQNVLMSLVGSIDLNHHRLPRPTEEPLELEEILMRKLMARV
ncbi:uncharacterized protein LOC132553234 [Ylistrum balloti]|uniref:uncharacterized protein LOC132553234 n=1 Tax=Ylistrum balloti TaxID=509963 RepID=UPI002905BFF7|nr:uncharacterized protein LOC132553234 [Ylistrum balloti]